MNKSLPLVIIFLLFQLTCFSQLTVTADSSANALAQNIAGSGVIVSNATINCNGQAVSDFSYSGANLGLTNGIILSTGMASDAAYSATSFGDPSTDFGTTFTDPDLTTIEPNATNDVCIVAFDFVPICSSLSITFVFASSEYDGFVCAGYNDAFGIFLTGPKPAGGSYTGLNIATLPNGTVVSIHNVNNGDPNEAPCPATNSTYFVDNLASPNNQIAYPGYTIPVTSITPVSPCSTYHMKIAIADAGDGSFDSAVFIQGNSISCTNTPTVTASTTDASCSSLGSAVATVTNYTGTPTYQWEPGGATTASISNLTAGTYSCIIGLQSGCGLTTQTIVATVLPSPVTFSYTTSAQNPLCINGTTGSASVTVSGGTAPYSYSWNTNPGTQTTNPATGLAAGVYTVNVKDNTGCIGSTTVALTNPPPIVATVNTLPTICTGSTGTATVNVISGGTGPYTYTWATPPVVQTGSVAINLAQGMYTVAIQDNNSCLGVSSGSVSSTGYTWIPTASSTNPKCVGFANGTATVGVNNAGTSSFTYSWTTAPVQTNTLAINLSAQTYSVFVTDNNGCVGSTTVTLANPPPVTATITTLPTICKGSVGSATAIVTGGGTTPYTYLWSNAQTTYSVSNLAQGMYTVAIMDVNSCTVVTTGSVTTTGFTWLPVATSSPTQCNGSADGTATVTTTNSANTVFTSYLWMPTAQTTTVANMLPMGDYTVTVGDNNGCVLSTTVAVTEPSKVMVSTLTTPAICTTGNGTADALAYGGTGPYTYTWTVTNPLQTTKTATNLVQGQYQVLVSDAHSCTVTAIVIVKDSTDLTVKASQQSPDLCLQGVGKAIANPKGQSNYTYSWTPTGQTTQVADSLKPGVYSVIVTDGFNCVSSASVSIINQNDILSTQFINSPAGPIYAEDAVTLDLVSNSGWAIDSAFLSTGDTITKNPFPYKFTQYGDYTATYYFTSIHGCRDTVVINLVVKDYITLYIPNTFTPNGDGKNDFFAAEGTFVNTFEMSIYDRWGILVTKLDNITKVWDGSKNGSAAPEDVYVYKGDASDIFGKRVTFQGQINLIR